METVKVDIIFRKFNDGDIIALMPHDVETFDGCINSYMHVGQHSSANYNRVIQISKLATETEYADLKEELESIGYVVNVIKKRNYDKYLASYKSLRNR